MTATVTELDMEVVQGFAFEVFGDITAQQMGPLTTVGDRLGLWQTLAEIGPVTSTELAARAGLHERYAREWLAAMACHGYLKYDAETGRFRLPAEHAFVLSNTDSPLYLRSVFSMSEASWRHIDQLAEAFLHGGGIPQSEFGDRFWCGFERFTGASFKNFLNQDWIPAVPSVDAALRNGGSAADIGCGNGQALLTLARAYPQATLIGYDNYAPAIAAATANARAAGLDDTVRYAVRDVTEGIPGSYDLITLFDVVHDAPHPVQLLTAVARALKPGVHLLHPGVQLFRRRPAQPRASAGDRRLRLLREPELLHDAGAGGGWPGHRDVYGRGAPAGVRDRGRLRESRAPGVCEQPVQHLLHIADLTPSQ